MEQKVSVLGIFEEIFVVFWWILVTFHMLGSQYFET